MFKMINFGEDLDFLQPQDLENSEKKQKMSFLGTIQQSIQLDPRLPSAAQEQLEINLATGENYFKFKSEVEKDDMENNRKKRRKSKQKETFFPSKINKIYPEDILTTEADNLKTQRKATVLWETARKVYLSKCATKK